MAHDVFISYAHQNANIANAVCAALEQEGIRCWIAPRDVPPGSIWPQELANAIVRARILVLVMTSRVNESVQVRSEVERAISAGKIVVPLQMEHFALSEELMYYLGRTHWLDAASPPLERHLDRVIDTVRSVLSPASRGPASARDDTPPAADHVGPPGAGYAVPPDRPTAPAYDAKPHGSPRPPRGTPSAMASASAPPASWLRALVRRLPRSPRARIGGAVGASLLIALTALALRIGWTGEDQQAIASARDAFLSERFDEAASLAEAAIRRDDGAAWAHAILANIAFERYWVDHSPGRASEGERHLLSAERADAADPVVRTARANYVLLVERDTTAAIGRLESALAASGDDPYTHHQLGFALALASRHREAVPHYREAMRLRPRMAWVRSNLTNALAETGECDDAATFLAASPDSSVANGAALRYRVGQCFERAGRREEALGAYRRASADVPDNHLYADGVTRLDLRADRIGSGDGTVAQTPAVLQALLPLVALAKSKVEELHYGFADGTTFLAGLIQPSASSSITLTLEQGEEYLFLAYGDDDSRDVDIEVTNESATAVAEDSDAERAAVTEFRPAATGSYTIRVRLYASDGPAFCGLLVMRKHGWNIPVTQLARSIGQIGEISQALERERVGGYVTEPGQWSIWGAVVRAGNSLNLTNVTLGSGKRALLLAPGVEGADLTIDIATMGGTSLGSSTASSRGIMVPVDAETGEQYKLTVTNKDSDARFFVAGALGGRR